MKRLLIAGVTASVVILSIAASLLFNASRNYDPQPAGCYHVVDVSGKDWYFADQPQYDINVGAIQLDTGYSTGWVWPASVEATYRCIEGLDGA